MELVEILFKHLCLFELSVLKHCLSPSFNYLGKIFKLRRTNLSISLHNVMMAVGCHMDSHS